ncbi:DUF3080 family protein [Pelagibaculum spongiae]|uniref:DUF3080 domain-containing protein n=1 Tax=Pelagibaculum spongiae TaxID=2080658 RepID=A0A2V1H2S5_9GAMM|nr:DUF3080 family protein [Pelagibaculum spongiae]PVZ69597.1 hypothetical protein DC094_09800 [Pelagibaculum spongiae]
MVAGKQALIEMGRGLFFGLSSALSLGVLRLIVLLLISVSGLLAGCSGSDRPSREYLQRLERVTDMQPLDFPRSDFFAVPNKPDALIKEVRVSFNLLESIELDRCGILSLLAEANGPLGKIQNGPPRLQRELKLFQLTKQCIDSGRAGDLIKQVDRLRRGRWSVRFWNILLESPEVGRLYAASGLQGDVVISLSRPLQILLQAQRSPERVNIDNVYPAFQALSNFAGGKFWRELKLLTAELQLAEERVEAFSAMGSCNNPFRRKQVKRMQGLLYRYFIPEIQTRMVLLARQAELLEGFWLEMLKNKRLLVGLEFQNYLNRLVGQGGLVSQFRKVSVSHAQAWNDLLKKCDMSPGVNRLNG